MSQQEISPTPWELGNEDDPIVIMDADGFTVATSYIRAHAEWIVRCVNAIAEAQAGNPKHLEELINAKHNHPDE